MGRGCRWRRGNRGTEAETRDGLLATTGAGPVEGTCSGESRCQRLRSGDPCRGLSVKPEAAVRGTRGAEPRAAT